MKFNGWHFTKNRYRNADEIKTLIERGAAAMFARQPNIFGYTSLTGQTEWNLAHHLAFELMMFFPKYDCDLDVTKHNHHNQRPDIIFHRRGSVRHDFLVIEVKLNDDSAGSGVRNDIQKIRNAWFDWELNYKFGAVIKLNWDKTFTVQVFQNENWERNRQMQDERGFVA